MEKQDKKRLTAFEEQAAVLLPQLRARKTEVETKLVKERKAVAEIESCDQAELAAYKEAIAEQRCVHLIILQTMQIDPFAARKSRTSAPKLQTSRTNLLPLQASWKS